MGQIKKLYQDNENVETTVTTESNAVYPITAASAVYYSGAWGNLGNNKDTQTILTALDGGHQFVGVATASTNPSTPTHKVFYIASEPGTYTHFGNITVTGLCVLKSNGSNWTKQDLNITIDNGGGGDSSVSIDGYIGGTRVQSSSGIQDLVGISSLRIESSGRIYFGGSNQYYIEHTANGFHFSDGLYSDSFVAAGGVGSSSGGSGGGSSYTAGTGITISNNTISLASATETTIGGIRVAIDVSTNPTLNSITTAENRNYRVQCNPSGVAFVNVPWIEGGGNGNIQAIQIDENTFTPESNGVVDITSGIQSMIEGYISGDTEFAVDRVTGGTVTIQDIVDELIALGVVF